MSRVGDRIRVNGADRPYVGTVRAIMVYSGAVVYVVLPDHADRHDMVRESDVKGAE